MNIFPSLDREQREAVVLLLLGTFLESFDLFLYVHMAVLLNERFFTCHRAAYSLTTGSFGLLLHLLCSGHWVPCCLAT